MNIKSEKTQRYATIVCLLVFMIVILLVFSKSRIGNSPRDIVLKFLTASNDEERLEYILDKGDLQKFIDSENLQSIINTYDDEKRNYSYEEDRDIEELNDGEYTRVKLFKIDSSSKDESGINIFYLKKVDGKFMIDTEPSTRENKYNFLEIKKENIKNIQEMKLYASLDLYNEQSIKKEYIVKDEDRTINYNDYLTVALKDPETGFTIQGIIPRRNKTSEYLYEYLKTGGYKEIIVDIQLLENGDINNTQFKIIDVKSWTWQKYNNEFKFENR